MTRRLRTRRSPDRLYSSQSSSASSAEMPLRVMLGWDGMCRVLLRRRSDGRVLYRPGRGGPASPFWGSSGVVVQTAARVCPRVADGYGPGWRGPQSFETSREHDMARRSRFGEAALLMGAAALAAGVLLKRDKVAGLLPSGSGGGTETTPGPAPVPAPANYDAPGPVANTATPVPAPEPAVRPEGGGIDEAAEEAAAAAEAANIGGPVSDYAAIDDPTLSADEAERPLVEAGEGTAEGREQAEAALADAAQPSAPGMSDYERQIDEAIDAAAEPSAGEHPEPLAPTHPGPGDAEARAAEAAAAADLAAQGATPQPTAGGPTDTAPEPATVPAAPDIPAAPSDTTAGGPADTTAPPLEPPSPSAPEAAPDTITGGPADTAPPVEPPTPPAPEAAPPRPAPP